MLCAGSVRAKNAKNIILLNLLDACLGVIIWWAVGECASAHRRIETEFGCVP
jgi:Amt family ammonium transporter